MIRLPTVRLPNIGAKRKEEKGKGRRAVPAKTAEESVPARRRPEDSEEREYFVVVQDIPSDINSSDLDVEIARKVTYMVRAQDTQYNSQPVLRIRDVYPGSRILIFTHPGSRIPDPGSRIPDPGSKNR